MKRTGPARVFGILGAGLLAWLVIAAVFTVLEKAIQAGNAGPRAIEITWTDMAKNNLTYWAGWTVLAPGIYAMVQRTRTAPATLGVLVWLLSAAVCVLVQAVIASGVASLLHYQQFAPGLRALSPGQQFRVRLSSGTLLNLFTFAAIAMACLAIVFARDLQARRVRQAQLEARLAHAELQILRAQLQPHFFFNTLHTVSALMESDVLAARRVLALLGDLLRMSIDHAGEHEIELREELSFARRYLDIQLARFHDRLTVQYAVPEALEAALVPSLVLQPLIENAVKHGIEPHPSPGRIEIAARPENGRIVISVTNWTGASGDAMAAAAAVPGRGIGLDNVARRLEQLYPDAHTFQAAPLAGGYRVQLSIPLRMGAAERPGATA